MTAHAEKAGAETYVVGKRDFNSYFVTVCRQGSIPLRQEGFKTVDQARAWIKERNKSNIQRPAEGSHLLS